MPKTAFEAASLRRLREEAGYSTACAFAQSLGVTRTTYSRYEKDPSKIPLPAAWRMADALGCTIDDVVGRTRTAAPSENEVQSFYDSVSDESRALIDGYFSLIELRERSVLPIKWGRRRPALGDPDISAREGVMDFPGKRASERR